MRRRAQGREGRSAGFQGRAWFDLDTTVGRSYASHRGARARCCDADARCLDAPCRQTRWGAEYQSRGRHTERAKGQSAMDVGQSAKKQWTWRRVRRVTSRQLNRANDGDSVASGRLGGVGIVTRGCESLERTACSGIWFVCSHSPWTKDHACLLQFYGRTELTLVP